jgi:p-hydroxybenzoate 3-monooxygenase
MRAHLGLVGGGPAGILLSHLSHPLGVESMVFEPKSRQEVKTAAYIEFAAIRLASVGMLLRAGLLLARQKESPPPSRW